MAGMRFVAVLVHPARPANVGAAARALKNFGGAELRLVGGEHALPGGSGHDEARALAWNAADMLEAARAFASLPEAIADCALTVAATGRAEPGRDVLTPRELAAEAAALPADARVACVFGPEDSGLTNAEMDGCRARLRIPTAADQPSLNLAQAVVVVAYEMAVASPASQASRVTGDEPAPAHEGEIARLDAAFRDLALEAGFLNPQAPEHVAGELRRLLARARPSSREITILQGLIAQLHWHAHHRRKLGSGKLGSDPID